MGGQPSCWQVITRSLARGSGSRGTKSGLGKADTTQVDRYSAGRSPGASETQKRDCLTAKEGYTAGGELSGEGVRHSL